MILKLNITRVTFISNTLFNHCYKIIHCLMNENSLIINNQNTLEFCI